jgi:hypothetical protein
MVAMNRKGVLRAHSQPLEMGEPKEQSLPNAQFAKPIEVDDDQYLPGVGILDWAEEYHGLEEYHELGGEG